jgi:hypothetical protein
MVKGPTLDWNDYRGHSFTCSILIVFRWSDPPWVWVEKVVLSDLKVIPYPPPFARTNSFVCPQVPNDPLGVPVNNSLPVCTSRCLSICQVKHLDLRGVQLISVCPESLQVLLELQTH